MHLMNWLKIFDIFKEPLPTAPEHCLKDPAKIKSQYKHWRLRMFLGMYLGYVAYYFTRKNLAPVMHIFGEELGIDLMHLGILNSIFYITYGVGKFLSGALADRANIRFFMPLGLLLASLINLFFGFIETLWILAFFWGLNGAVQSMGFPPVAKGLVYWFHQNERATKWTIWSSAHTAGTFMVGILCSFILKYFDWKAAFYIPGILGILTSIILYFTLRDRPISLGLPSIEDHTGIKPAMEKSEDEKNMSQWQIIKTYVFTNPNLWLLGIIYIFVYIIRFGTLDWGTVFLYQERAIDKTQVALLWSLMPLLGMPGGITAGYLSDKFFQGRCTTVNIIYMIILAFCCYGLYYFASPNHIGLTCLFLGGIGFFVDGPQNLVGGVQTSRCTVKEATSTAIGFVGLFGYIGAIISGAGLALITKTWGWTGTFYFFIASCVLTVFLLLLCKEK